MENKYYYNTINELITYLHDIAEEEQFTLYNDDRVQKVLDNKQDKVISLTLINNKRAYTEIFRYSFYLYPSINEGEKRYRLCKEKFTLYQSELEALRGGR